MKKIELVNIKTKKDSQILQDISMTMEERFIRMFDLIEFCFAFFRLPKIPTVRNGMTVFTLKKSDEQIP